MKRIKYLSLFLALLFCIFSFSSCMSIDDVLSKIPGVNDSSTDSGDTKDPSTDDPSTDDPSNDGSNGSLAYPDENIGQSGVTTDGLHMLTRGNGVNACSIPSNSSATTLLGFYTDQLKANTKYKVTWTINPLVKEDYPFHLITSPNENYCVYLEPSYVPGEPIHYVDGFENNDSDILVQPIDGATFTSGAEGDVCVFMFFTCMPDSLEQGDEYARILSDYTTSFKIVEVKEAHG